MSPRYSNHNGDSVAAVLYFRRSSDRQEKSIPDQRSALKAYALAHGYKIVGEYIDDAVSGDKTEDRAGFLQMRDDADSGKFEAVLCWDQDRFGRFDPLDAGHWIYPFRQAGVRLETIAQGKIDWEDLTDQMVYTFNQFGKNQFLRDLSRNTVRGLLASAKEGTNGTGGSTPYGYRSANGTVSIVESEAEIVRLIFELFLAPGGSVRSVTCELNRRGVPSPGGSVWRMNTVLSILKRRKYIGAFVYLDHSSGTYFTAQSGEIVPRRKADRVERTDPIVHEDRFEAIVDRETFDEAQAKLKSNRTKTARKQTRQYPLSGLMICGDCNATMVGMRSHGKPIYRCATYQTGGSNACHCNQIHENLVLTTIVRMLQKRYLSKPALDRLRKALEAEQNGTGPPGPRPRDLSRLSKQIEILDRKIDQGADRVLDAPSELVPTLYRKIEDLKSKRDRLNTELESLTSGETRSNGKDDKEIDQAIDALKSFGKALAKARPEETKELLSSIVSKIELNFEHKPISRRRNVFTSGTIYLRQDAADGPIMNTTGSFAGTV